MRCGVPSHAPHGVGPVIILFTVFGTLDGAVGWEMPCPSRIRVSFLGCMLYPSSTGYGLVTIEGLLIAVLRTFESLDLYNHRC
jgi:hypothetical protein